MYLNEKKKGLTIGISGVWVEGVDQRVYGWAVPLGNGEGSRPHPEEELEAAILKTNGTRTTSSVTTTRLTKCRPWTTTIYRPPQELPESRNTSTKVVGPKRRT
ncbi:hypothetical protein SK128_018973, partial [Halocaridina rubra]